MGHHEELLKSWEMVFDKYYEEKRLVKSKVINTSNVIDRFDPGLIVNLASTKNPPLQPSMSAEERLSELFRVFSQRVGTGAVIPEMFSARLIHFYRAVLHPQDRCSFIYT